MPWAVNLLRALLVGLGVLVLGNVRAAADSAPRLMVQSTPGATISTGGSLVFSVDNRLLASTSNAQQGVQIWETKTGRLLCNLDRAVRGYTSIVGFGAPAIAFSRDALMVATAVDAGAIALWDLTRCVPVTRLNLEPRQRQPVKALSTLADGRVLVLGGDGVFYVGDLFRRDAKPDALTGDGSESAMLLAHSSDARIILEARFDMPGVGDALMPRKTLVVRDRASGKTETLESFSGGTSSRGLFQAAALSPSGRWIAVHNGNELALYDRESKRLVHRLALSGNGAPDAAASVPTARPQKRTIDDALAKQRRRQLERLEEKIKGLPPEQHVRLRKQVEQAFGEATQEVEARAANPPDIALPGMADALLRGAQWMGFSPDEEHIYVWRNRHNLPLAQSGAASNLLAFEVRRRGDLGLVATHAFDESGAARPGDLRVAASFAQSDDRTLLALQGVGANGAKMMIVDLIQQRVRAWAPAAGLPVAAAWDERGRLVTVNALPTASGDAALSARAPDAAIDSDALTTNTEPRPWLSTRFVRWDLSDGDVIARAIPDALLHSPPGVSINGRYGVRATLELVSNAQRGLSVQVDDLGTMQTQWKGAVRDAHGRAITMAPIASAVASDGKHVVVALPGGSTAQTSTEARRAGGLNLLIIEVGSGRVLAQHDLPFSALRHLGARALSFSPDGRYLVIPAEKEVFILGLDLAQKVQRLKLEGEFYGVYSTDPVRVIATENARESRSRRAQRRQAAVASDDPSIEQAAVLALKRIAGVDRIAVTDGTGTLVAASGAYNRIELYRLEEDRLQAAALEMSAHSARITALAFSPDARYLASTSEDGATVLWNLTSGQWMAKLFTFADGTWAVIDPQGRFDTNNLEEIEHLHWVVPDNPLHALPLEIFMRDYYEPRLLPRLLAGETLAPVRALSALNRAQPEVKITAIESDAQDASRVYVNVQVNSGGGAVGQAGEVHDLSLFRDGRLVATHPANGGAVQLEGSGGARIRLGPIRLPTGAQPVQFSAYVFNRDRVKSATVRAGFQRSTGGSDVAKRAYIISIGVNEHDSPVWNLSFAANDARRTREVLTRRLATTRGFREIVGIELIADAGGLRNATKAKIDAVLAALAGRKVDAALLAGITHADKLKPATPDDLIIISFSGHGIAGQGGAFYLLPSDIGGTAGRTLSGELKGRAISTDDLAVWLKHVDAGDLIMIVDACHSAATVEAEGFKPGPMGSRGLGQLAYDKGMRILAASHADDVALESGTLRHGLLTYALISDGMEDSKADFRPVDQRIDADAWLVYGVERVPQLFRTATQAQGDDPQRGATRRVKATPREAQQPKLFDFARTRAHAPLVILR